MKNVGPQGPDSVNGCIANKQTKVRPVMDYRELNKYVDAYTANVDVCAQKLGEW